MKAKKVERVILIDTEEELIDLLKLINVSLTALSKSDKEIRRLYESTINFGEKLFTGLGGEIEIK